MKKSIVVIGKGPSVLQSTEEFISTFDEVAICNFPPIEGYEKYIGKKADYHFFNAHDPNPYKQTIQNELGLKEIYNTHHVPHPGYKTSFPEHNVMYDPEYGQRTVREIKERYGFHPSTGTQAFYFFVQNPSYDKIGLVGIDYFKVGQRGYYYPPSEVQQSLRYLYSRSGDTPFDAEGVRVQENSHDSGKTRLFVEEMSRMYGKTVETVCRRGES